jgi:hypothetical protein
MAIQINDVDSPRDESHHHHEFEKKKAGRVTASFDNVDEGYPLDDDFTPWF